MQNDASQHVLTIQTIRNKAMADLATVQDYATAINKCERSVWSYIREGLPVTYIGRTAYVVLSKATAYWAGRAREHTTPKVGRPRKQAA